METLFLQDDEKTKEELLQNAEVTLCTYKDTSDILDILKKAFKVRTRTDAFMQLVRSNADLENSVKIIDKRDGKIYGILIFCNNPICQGSPIGFTKYAPIALYLSHFKILNGHSFVIDSRLRNTKLDIEMLMFNSGYTQNYDYIWCGVEKDLRSHSYWKRLGFMELFSIPEASFYIRNTKSNNLLDIFILKELCDKKNEKDIFERKTRAFLNRDSYQQLQ